MVIAVSGKNGLHPRAISGGAITTEQEFPFATASSPNLIGSSSFEQSTFLYRVVTLRSFTYFSYILRNSVTIFSTRLLEIYVESSLGLGAFNEPSFGLAIVVVQYR